MQRKCVCNVGGHMWYADSFDKDNGKPCSWCNPAGLAKKHGGRLGEISVCGVWSGAKSHRLTARYACGCSSAIHGNGHLSRKPTRMPTLCARHKKPMTSFRESMVME